MINAGDKFVIDGPHPEWDGWYARQMDPLVGQVFTALDVPVPGRIYFVDGKGSRWYVLEEYCIPVVNLEEALRIGDVVEVKRRVWKHVNGQGNDQFSDAIAENKPYQVSKIRLNRKAEYGAYLELEDEDEEYIGVCPIDAVVIWKGNRVRHSELGVGVVKEQEEEMVTEVAIQEHIGKIRDQLKLLNADRGLCNYGNVTLSGDGKLKHNIQASDICHARVCRNGYNNAEKVLAVLDVVHDYEQRGAKPEEYIRLVDWHINRGPYAKFYRQRSAKIAITKGLMLDGSKATHTEIMGACIMLRMATEYRGWLSLWIKLVDAGIDEGVAWVVAANTISSGQKWALKQHGGHSLHTDNHGVKALLDFMKRGPIREHGDKPAAERVGTLYVFRSVGPVTNYDWSIVSEFKAMLKAGQKEDAPRAFGAAANTYTTEQMIALAKQLEEMK